MKTKLCVLFIVGVALCSTVGIAQNNPPAANEVVDMIKYDDATLVSVIESLARQANINIQLDPKLVATNLVRLRWEKMTPQAALLAVLDNHSLLLVTNPAWGVARITAKDPNTPEPQFVKVYQLKYAGGTNLVGIIKPTISAKGQVLADGRTSQLIVFATENDLRSVDTLIAKLDMPTKQVLIEARLLQTLRNPTTIKGIDWSGTLAAQNIAFGNGLQSAATPSTTTTVIPGATTTTSTSLPGGRTVTSSSTSPSDSSTTLNFLHPSTLSGLPGGLSANTALGLHPATAFLNADGVRAVLSFLNTDSDTELLATPRTVTLDNQTATLSVTRAFPIIKITPGSANSPPGSEITYTNLGVILTVTPHISADQSISMRLIPEVSDRELKPDEQVIGGTLNRANIFAVTRIEANVSVPNGHTLVMGGLSRDQTDKAYTKVPLLGDLPILGLAFRKESKTRLKQNLLIFITPTIVERTDYQEAPTEFLKNKYIDRPAGEESAWENAWDGAKPHDWSKPVY